jgi:ABC-2 type transport system ATP-binding protein
LRLDQVGKRYGIRLPWVVRDASLEIPAGGLVRFEGKNGSGKSTLLRIIAGVSIPSRGTVTGRMVTGYVPERFPAALPFPAREYLSHLGRVHGLAGPDLAARIDACLDRLGGRELGPVPLRNMSKGMCQKVAVAQALLPRSGLLVLDEAWTGLDIEAKAALDEVVAERLADGGSVVFVDHEPGRLARLAGERWRLENGRATRVTTGISASGSAAGAESAGAGVASVVVIELTGEIPELDGLPGVVSAQQEAGRLIVRVARDASDAVLRTMLAGDSVHVLRVGDEPPVAEAGR